MNSSGYYSTGLAGWEAAPGGVAGGGGGRGAGGSGTCDCSGQARTDGDQLELLKQDDSSCDCKQRSEQAERVVEDTIPGIKKDS